MNTGHQTTLDSVHQSGASGAVVYECFGRCETYSDLIMMRGGVEGFDRWLSGSHARQLGWDRRGKS